jgi:PAS domain S-box-containing protein
LEAPGMPVAEEALLRAVNDATRAFVETNGDRERLIQLVSERVASILNVSCVAYLLSASGEEWSSEAKAQGSAAPPDRESGFAELEPIGRYDVAVVAALASGLPTYPATAPAGGSAYPSVLVPLRAATRAWGVLHLARVDPGSPPWGTTDTLLAQHLALAASASLEHAEARAIAERQARERAEEKFHGLLESAPDAIVIIDPTGRIAMLNAQAASLFGYPRAELLGQTVEVLVPHAYRRLHPERRASYVQAPRIRHSMAAGVELFGLKQDGTEFPAEISLSPMETPEGRMVIAVVRDVTYRRRLEEERARSVELEALNHRAQEANRLKSEFLANMSHELRTPLNAIIGFSSLLHAGRVGKLTDTQVEYLGDILVSSRHLLQLINDVLDLAKVEAGKLELELGSVDLSRLAAEVRDILRGLAAEKHVELDIDVAPEVGPVQADARLLKQILYNYLSNAIKFTPEHGKVSVRIWAPSAATFKIEVEDSGIGIKPDDMRRLFVEFQQLDASGRKYPGTGLGLALTKRLIEAQGGTVSVVSVVGKGSTFAAELPRQGKPSEVKA